MQLIITKMAERQASHRFHNAAIVILLLLLVAAVFQCDAARQGKLKHYSVHLRSSLPIAAYRGGFAVYPGGWTDDDETQNTSSSAALDLKATPATVAAEARNMVGRGIPRRARLTMENPQIRAHASMLEYQQNQIAASVGLPADQITYSFKYAMNGFAALLTPVQARKLRRHAAVAAVTESRRLKKLTTDSPTFLDMKSVLWNSNGGQLNAGDGMVIGMIDSGIWPEHPSFDDSYFSSTMPAGWTGTCDTTADFECNKKIIGARIMCNAAKENLGGEPDLSADWLSPRDADGHGTWCAGVAAGNHGVSMAGGKASGMAPAARLAIYKVAWTYRDELVTELDDVYAALDQAVADGVDVISLSLGGTNPLETYFDDIPFLYANLAGVVTVAAAGNGGAPSGDTNKYRTISNFSPFYLTVGASTIMRGGAVLVKSNVSTAENAAPKIAAVSSTGPLNRPWTDARNAFATNSILKPDVVAPGVKIVSGYPAATARTIGTFTRQTGTSIASAHMAGIAALILQKYPKWSPAQVMSAIMTTAITKNTGGGNIKNANKKDATPWQMGHGHVDPDNVLDPGLTFDTSVVNYRNFLAGQSLKMSKSYFPNAQLTRIPPRNLNRPSISISRLKGTLIVRRVVTNVARATSTYVAKVESMIGVDYTVDPGSFTIAPGAKQKYTVTFKVVEPSQDFQFGSFTWEGDMGHSVRTVMAIQPIEK